jgi:hypothetical protein
MLIEMFTEVLSLIEAALLNGAPAQATRSSTFDVGYATYLGNQTYPNTARGIPWDTVC